MSKINKILLVLLLTLCSSTFAQTTDTLKQKPQPLPYWTFWVPGASYFHQGKIIQGSIFSTLEIGGIYLGIKYDRSLKNNSSSPYYNYPLFLGLQAFQTEKLTQFRNQLEIIKFHNPDFNYDESSEKDLYLAPFKARNILTPITGGMVLLAAAFLGIEKYNEVNRFSDIDKMYFLDRYITRNQGLAVFGSTSLGMSWSAGVGEEYICRNWLMPLLDFKYGKKRD